MRGGAFQIVGAEPVAPPVGPPEPTDWQARVMSVPETYNLALLGGRGGGKTTALGLLALRHCAQYRASARVLIIRSTYKSLAQIWDDVLSMFEAAYGKVEANKAEHIIKCPDGATVTMANLGDRRDYVKLQGRETTLLAVDEITNFTTIRFINMLQANLRGPNNVPTRMVILGNPGGPLHAAIAKMHVHGRAPWKPYQLEDGSQWVFAPSTYLENPHIDQRGYAARIIASAGHDRALSEAWLNGNWNDLAGAFFADVFGDHLILPTTDWIFPEGRSSETGWRTSISLDWGWSAPSVALLAGQARWHGVLGPDDKPYAKGSWIVLGEVHTARADDPNVGRGWPPGMLAEEIVSQAKRFNVRPLGVGDDARGLTGDTLLVQLRQHGLSLRRPTKDRISGWVKLKSLMAAAKQDDPDTPAIFFHPRCRYTLETLPLLPRDDLRLEDLDTQAADHAADAARYLVNSELPTVKFGKTYGV